MRYIGEFEALNLNIYRLEIDTKKGSGTKYLTLGGNPFITEMSVDEEQIYTPIKGTSATIEILTDDYIFDMYSENPTDTQVKLINTSDNNKVEWSGYITPQIFNQSFELGINAFSIEAVDGLSALENIKYVSTNKDALTFEEIIKKILSNIDVKYMFVSDNVQLNSATGTETILDKLFISEMNFFNEKSDTETDDDVCWKCLDVLSEICQYLGYVATMVGEDLYLLDYDAIKHGVNTYYRYDIKNGGNPVRTTFNHTKKIEGNDHYSNNASVSLDKIYNKVSVRANTYEFSDPTETTYADKNITSLDNTKFSSSYGQLSLDYIWAEVFPSDDDQSKAIDCWIDVHHDQQQGGTFLGMGNNKSNYYDFVAMKFIKKTNSNFFLYDKNMSNVTSQYENAISYDDFSRVNGGIYVKYFTKNLDKQKTSNDSYVRQKWAEYYRAAKTNPNLTSKDYLDYCLEASGIHSISWTDAILLNNLDAANRPNESEWYKFPYYQVECEGSLIQGGENSAIIIQGSFYWHFITFSANKIDSYPMEFNGYQLDKKNWINPNEDMFIPASVQWGDLWWNGKEWQNTKCGFKLNWMDSEYRDDNATKKKSDTIEEWKCQKTIMQPQPITNTVSWRFGTNEEGHLIPVPQGQNLNGKPILTIYRPVSGRVWKSRKDYYNGDKTQGQRWPWYFCALIGLKFKSLMGDPSYSDANDTDTIYTNVLENDTIEELEPIEFKIHTFDEKVNSYGSVAINGGNQFLNKTYNKALATQQADWYDSNNNLAKDGLRQEEHLIYKLVNQYTTPSKMLECEMKDGIIKPYGLYTDTTLTGSYIINSIGTDYRNSYNNVKLLEKK